MVQSQRSSSILNLLSGLGIGQGICDENLAHDSAMTPPGSCSHYAGMSRVASPQTWWSDHEFNWTWSRLPAWLEPARYQPHQKLTSAKVMFNLWTNDPTHHPGAVMQDTGRSFQNMSSCCDRSRRGPENMPSWRWGLFLRKQAAREDARAYFTWLYPVNALLLSSAQDTSEGTFQE